MISEVDVKMAADIIARSGGAEAAARAVVRALEGRLLPAGGIEATRTRVVIPSDYEHDTLTVKCDAGSVGGLLDEHGGRVQISTITVYPDGSELLGPWREVDQP